VFWRKKYEVKMTGRAGLIYSEGPRRMRIDSEVQSTQIDMIIFGRSIQQWEPPHQDEKLSTADILRIRENISKALRHLRVMWQ